jgi:hypothetical protein
MQPVTAPENAGDDFSVVGIIRIISGYLRMLWIAAVVAASVALVLAGLYYFRQPVRSVATLWFRPSFEGADKGLYPNGIPFAPTDILAPSVLEQVYDKNGLQQECPRDVFRSSFYVEIGSLEYESLETDYRARLADTRLSIVDRDRLIEEYKERRAMLKPAFKLNFTRGRACKALLEPAMFKALADVLMTWAQEAEEKRGVLKMRVPVLGPQVLDVEPIHDNMPIVRADLIRRAMRRVISNIQEVENVPGADLIRVGPDRVSLAEVRARVEDLETHTETLMATVGGGGRASTQWIEQAMQSARIMEQSESARAEAFRMALREYSGAPSERTGPSGVPPSREQGAQPQIDSSFIDRLLQVSAANTAANTSYRQDLTRSMTAANAAAIEHRRSAEQYKRLSEAMRQAGSSGLAEAEVNQQLDRVVEEGKKLLTRFGQLYDELSRVALRPAGAMYQTEKGPQFVTLRAFSLQQVFIAGLAALVAAWVLGSVAALVHHRLKVA